MIRRPPRATRAYTRFPYTTLFRSVLPVVDTIIRDGVNIDRAGLMRVQTPQAFRFDSILAAHRAWTGSEPTDDAEVARAAGLRVAEVGGDEMLKKLTAPDDFGWAERTLTGGMTTPPGQGFGGPHL